MKRKLKTKTATKEKYAIYLDQADLNRLRDYQVEVGVPVSESIRRAIAAYVEQLKKKA
jgi:post-segregation antitoxin (ccd killing protein)